MKEQRPQTQLNGSATYSGEYLDMTTVSEWGHRSTNSIICEVPLCLVERSQWFPSPPVHEHVLHGNRYHPLLALVESWDDYLISVTHIHYGDRTKNNNRLLRQVCNETLFTEHDRRLSRLLPSSKGRTNTQCSRARCAVDFGFNPKWFKPHGVRKSVPTILRAAGGDDDGDILVYGRWKQVPTSLIYQGSSTTNNNRLLRQVCNETLLTEDDIRLSRLLPSSKGQNQLPQVRRFWSHGSW